jgi:AraC family transcriptional regulator
MDVRLEMLRPKLLAGKNMLMSFADNRTPELWKSFMPLRKSILHTVGTDLYSLQIYPTGFFDNFSPSTIFEKWAAIEVGEKLHVPDGLKLFDLPGGLYAVFTYRGRSTEGAVALTYIMKDWLPQSSYLLDDRPHFELLGEKYRNDDPASEEEFWIPVKPK